MCYVQLVNLKKTLFLAVDKSFHASVAIFFSSSTSDSKFMLNIYVIDLHQLLSLQPCMLT